MPYKFECGHNATEATESCTKGEGTVDHNTVTRWFKKVCLSCKNLDDQARLGRLEKVAFETMLQATEVNQASNTHKVPDDLDVIVWCAPFKTLTKTAKLCLTLSKYCKTFNSP